MKIQLYLQSIISKWIQLAVDMPINKEKFHKFICGGKKQLFWWHSLCWTDMHKKVKNIQTDTLYQVKLAIIVEGDPKALFS